MAIGVGRGVRTTPFGKKSLKLTVKFRSPEFKKKIDRENLEFLTKRPPSAKTPSPLPILATPMMAITSQHLVRLGEQQ
jgi:hypothetical protein